ncbi:MAG: TonB-dependent receptor [Prevotella sp.]|nr:TonB-dependent receptor [Prevotella sp.]
MMKQLNIRIPVRALSLVVGLLCSLGALAQQITVKGHVKDETGEPVIGATIRPVGAPGGTVTDFDGNFQMKADAGQMLNVTYVGYQDQQVRAAANLVIVLKEDAAQLNEVVVIGYGVAKKSDLTGSVTAIKPDEKNHGLQVSAQDMIQGKIAGVNVTNGGGTPGGGATIRIRGGSSLNASNDPLIVIDGMAMDNQGIKGAPNALAMVNPQDIETFTVLKDASATAIYGSRGSNGVIIITTKKGRKNMAPQVSYSGNVSVSMRQKSLDLLDAGEYRNFVNSYYGENSAAAQLLGNADTDWQKEIYRTAVSTDHNVTVAGGLKDMPYRVSVGFTDQSGILKTSNYKRFTGNVTINPTFFDDHLKLNVNGKFMYARTRYANGDAIGNATRIDPTQPVRADGYEAYGGFWQWTTPDDVLGSIYNDKAVANPVSNLEEKDDRANSFDYMANVEADYQIHGFEDLRLHVNLSGDWANGKQNTDMAEWGPSTYRWGNTGFTKENKYNLVGSAYAQYYKDFAKTQHIDVMAGYEMSKTKYWGNSLYYDTHSVAGKTADEIAAMKDTDFHSYSQGIWKGENKLQSYYGRLNYSAFDIVMLTATMRIDGSSRFHKDVRWGYFPSLALGIRASELIKADFLDDLKLRLGWGKTGQQDGIGNYVYFATYNVNTNNVNGRYPMEGNPTGLLYRPDAYNKDLKWETTTTSNIGLDWTFFNGRIQGSVDYYYRKTTDLINTASVSAGSNFRNQVTANIGSLKNSGVEAALTFRPIVTNDWQWEITTNFTYNKNEITELTGESSLVMTGGISSGTGNQCQAHSVGHPASSFYVFQQVYGEDGKPIEGMFVDRNGDGTISDADRYFYKSPAAPYLAGLSTRLQYKNWDLGIGLRASFGNYVFWDKGAGVQNTDKRFDSSFNYLQNTIPVILENGWTTYDNKCCLSDYYVQNASFLKCDNITLGYSFDKLFSKVSGRIYASATNVFTISKYDGLDPEVSGGIDNNIYPRPFTLLLGLNLNF